MIPLYAAAAFWLGSHFGISSTPVRGWLVSRIGTGAYLGVYSLLAFVALGLLIWAWSDARSDVVLFAPARWQLFLALGLMLIALVLIVGGLAGPNPTSVGQESVLGEEEAARGVLRITRHPVQWGMLLWGIAHMAANPELPTFVLAATIVLTTTLGMRLIDAKHAARDPDGWARFAERTSLLPFAAIVSGRNRLDLAEIGAVKMLVALAVFALLVMFHEFVSGGVPLALG